MKKPQENHRKLGPRSEKNAEKTSEGSFLELCVFAVFFVVIFSVIARTAHAQAPAANISATLPELKSPQTFGWATKLTLETSQNLASDAATKYGGWYQVATSYTDNKTDLMYALSVGWFQEYTEVKETCRSNDLDNPIFTVSKTWTEGEQFRSRIIDSFTVGLLSTVGASYESTVHRSFIGAVGPTAAVSKLLFGKLHLGEMVAYAHGFYNYDIRDDGTYNSPNVFISKTDLSVDVLEKWAVSLSTKLSYGIDFKDVGKTMELSRISLDYTPSPALGFSLGAQTERGTQADDGLTNRVAFYDASVAQGFLDMSLNF